ncbi:hypothetical protein AXE46_RS08095 [Acinetobacter baumannii]|uniref:hypothetical protein n=1 Tax=Acinetobacter baumannii TaxID=470 RepID=UPI001DD9F51A|nr:hypothetical protein [Acinetobacter baumannii]EHU3413510.1 hypothetical protein [Acinetobacter baumannii]EIB6926478.1 hypothetical protein [Acinetobacter baumannii]MCY2805128.1 hypothetical protein [Acinetobacter baumannii]
MSKDFEWLKWVALFLVIGIVCAVVYFVPNKKNDQTSTQQITEQKELSPDEAKRFATGLLKKINDDEKLIRDAYELKEEKTLEKYVLNDWNSYVQKPFSEVEEKMGYGHLYFPSSAVMYPYTSCDTAFTDLNLLANALYQQVREDTATMRKIVRQEDADYLKSKNKCEERVGLTYEEALAAEESE